MAWKSKGRRFHRIVRGASNRGLFVFQPKGAALPPVARMSRGGHGGCGCDYCKGR